MPLDEGIEEVVTILTSYYEDGGRFLREQYGDQAPMMADEMGTMLGEYLDQFTPFGPLWAEYIRNPTDNEAEMIGALEVLEEAMPEVTIRLEGYYAAFIEMQRGPGDIVESPEPEDTINIEEIESIKSIDDGDNDDEYREEGAYLLGNVEDRSTSAMYYDEDPSVDFDVNQTEED